MGLVHILSGDDQGKITSALGIAVRAIGIAREINRLYPFPSLDSALHNQISSRTIILSEHTCE